MYRKYMILVYDNGRQDETTGSTDFTYQVPPVHSTSYTCGSSTAGVTLQDRDTAADLEQVSKFNSANQNMCSYAGTYHGVFSDRELFRQIYLSKTSISMRTFSRVQIPIPIFWQLLK